MSMEFNELFSDFDLDSCESSSVVLDWLNIKVGGTMMAAIKRDSLFGIPPSKLPAVALSLMTLALGQMEPDKRIGFLMYALEAATKLRESAEDVYANDQTGCIKYLNGAAEERCPGATEEAVRDAIVGAIQVFMLSDDGLRLQIEKLKEAKAQQTVFRNP